MWSATFELNDVLAVTLPILVILLSVIAGLVTYIIRRLVRSNDALVTKVQELETTLAHVEGRANGEEKRLTTLTDAIDIRFTALGDAYGHVREEMSSVDDRFDGFQRGLGNLNVRVDGLQQGLGNAGDRVDGLQQGLVDVKDRFGDMQQGLGTMRADVDAMNRGIEDIRGALARVDARFGDMQREIDRARSDLRQIREGEIPTLD